MSREEKKEIVVCPYCGTPVNDPDGFCPGCGNEVDPNRLYANPVGAAWRGMRMWHRFPVTGEPGERLVRVGLFVIGAVLFLPSFLGLIIIITQGDTPPVGDWVSIIFLALGTLAGFMLCYHSFWKKGKKGYH